MVIPPPPKEELIDKATKLIKAGVDSLIPGGAVATELLLNVIKMPYQKRSEEWQQKVTEALNKILTMGISLEQLQENDAFIDVLLQSIPIGLKNNQEEKREALKNALIHSGQDDAPDLSLQQKFLNCIDMFTIWHIKILQLFAHPQRWLEKNGVQMSEIKMIGTVRGLLENSFPELSGSREFVNSIWTDLYNQGFLNTDNSLLHTMMTSQGIIDKRTTDFGDQFIAFISD